MKNIVTLGIIFGLSGCSVLGAKYDTNEYAAFTNIAYSAALSNRSCNDPSTQSSQIERLKGSSFFAVLYTEYQPNNEETYKIAQDIDLMVDQLSTLSKTGKMSETYCQLKTTDIQQAAETAMKTTAYKRSQ
jgi:hypothetical protein